MKYNYTKKISLSYLDCIDSLKKALAVEGFGILTEIDIKKVMEKKLDVEYDNYLILGACNPKFAHKALQAEPEIGLMLPCNILVYEKNAQTFISAIMPSVAMGMIENETLQNIAHEINNKLIKVIDTFENEPQEEEISLYTCSRCDMKYFEKTLAQRCYDWCTENNSCNLEIIKHAKK